MDQKDKLVFRIKDLTKHIILLEKRKTKAQNIIGKAKSNKRVEIEKIHLNNLENAIILEKNIIKKIHITIQFNSE